MIRYGKTDASATSIAMSFMRIALRSMRKNPNRYYQQIIDNIPQVDRDILSCPELKKSYVNSTYESVRQGERDMLLEQLMIAKDWGFSVEDVTVPVTLWHGELDNYVPADMARKLAKKLPHSTLNFIPGAGHFLLYRIWDDIVSSLKEQVTVPAMVLAQKL